MSGELQGIQEVADMLGVTPRTLRFYEDKGLIEPSRIGTTRVYRRREIARMQLILRGKRLGFSLREIKEYLDLRETDPSGREQMRALLKRLNGRIARLVEQEQALAETLAEMRALEQQTQAALAAAEDGRKARRG